MIEVKAPYSYQAEIGRPAIFLAGSIEMGMAEEWQSRVVRSLSVLDVLLLNPRREAWDASWEQSIANPQFREQVEWELKAMEDAETIALYFSAGTKSPITLLELGVHSKANPQKLIVCCPPGFWRKGNVDVVCHYYGVQQVETLEELITALVTRYKG